MHGHGLGGMGYEHVWRERLVGRETRVLPRLVVWLEWQGSGRMESVDAEAAFVSTTGHSTA